LPAKISRGTRPVKPYFKVIFTSGYAEPTKRPPQTERGRLAQKAYAADERA